MYNENKKEYFMTYSVKSPYYSFSNLKKSLELNDTVLGIFDFSYNNRQYTLLFNYVDDEDKARLLFSKVGTQNTLSLTGDSECRVATFITKSKYNQLKEFFEIPYNGKEPFKPITLFKLIDSNLRYRPVNMNSPRTERATLYSLPNPNAIYYNYMIDWNTKSGNKHYSQFNRQKVKLLLPDLYHSLKGQNVTVFFKEEALNSLEELNAIKLDLSEL